MVAQVIVNLDIGQLGRVVRKYFAGVFVVNQEGPLIKFFALDGFLLQHTFFFHELLLDFSVHCNQKLQNRDIICTYRGRSSKNISTLHLPPTKLIFVYFNVESLIELAFYFTLIELVHRNIFLDPPFSSQAYQQDEAVRQIKESVEKSENKFSDC